MEKNLYELALKEKYRYNYRGLLSTEDLYDLDLKDLNEIYKGLKKEAKENEDDGLLSTKKVDNVLNNKIAIVAAIFNEKKTAKENEIAQRAKKEQNEKIMEIMAAKQDEDLKNMSIDELAALLQE